MLVNLVSVLCIQTHPAKAVVEEFVSYKTDVEARFKVYPNGVVSLGGVWNQTTSGLSFGTQQSVSASLNFSRKDGLTAVSVDTKITLPSNSVQNFPLNSTASSLLAKYSDQTLTVKLNTTTTLPASAKSIFPFNSTDFTLLSDYSDKHVNGNITIYFVGYPWGSMEFYGNKTDVFINGTAVIPFISIESTVIDKKTVVDALNYLTVNFTGEGPHSLWSLTKSTVKCLYFDNVTTFHPNYAEIKFDTQIEGDIAGILSLIAGLWTYPTYGYPKQPIPIIFYFHTWHLG